ncbi:MAG: class I SAM-dependent methyltransferase [Acutalibacteraceae bacterium]
MNDSEKLVVCMGKGASKDAAIALAEHIGAPLCDTPGEALTLRMDGDGLSLCGYGMTFRGDFTQMLYRITHGRLPHEMLARLSKTDVPHPTAVDATAGMGEDSLLLAACGYEVTLYEQNPVIAALLQDALHRAKSHPDLRPIVERMHPVEGDSTLWMPKMSDAPTLVYLDPMFPARQKSGLIHKKLQLIQKLEQPCAEESALLEAALAAHAQKIIIKRPLKGAPLAGKTPHYTVKGKAIRYDCFHFPAERS